MLESEGIECFVKDEAITSAHPFLSNAVGGVKLQVRESHYKRAEEILASKKEIHEEPINASSIPVNTTSKNICPLCSSTNIDKPRFSPQVFAIGILLLGFPIPFMKKRSHYFDCGKNFKI